MQAKCALFSCARNTLFCGICLLLFPGTALAISYVIAPDGTGDFITIQAGINAIAAGDTLLLADGAFMGTGNYDLDCHGLDIVIRSLHGPQATIIDPEYWGRGFSFHSGESRACVVEGITIIHGELWNDRGAGILCSNESSPTIRDCVVTDCFANAWGNSYGGGICCWEGSSPLFEDCMITENDVSGQDSWGGGVYIGSGAPEFRDCVISANYGERGGGFYIESGTASLISCVITGNYSHSGGGLDLYDSPGTVIYNCTIAANRSWDDGGGIRCGAVRLENTIVWGNCATHGDGDEIVVTTGQLNLNCCIVDTTGVEGSGSIVYETCVFDDPCFCAPALCDSAPTVEGDFSVDATSPCIPENNPCGEWIGALHVGCPFSDVIEDVLVLNRPTMEILPNPTTGNCRIRFYFPTASSVHIDLLDTEGRVVRSLWKGMVAGEHQVTWDGRAANGRLLPAGIYWSRLRSGETHCQRSILIVR